MPLSSAVSPRGSCSTFVTSGYWKPCWRVSPSICTPRPARQAGKNRALQARLNAAQRELKAWGVVFWDGPTHRRLISAGRPGG